jgi:tetratricopeptide (TPR) repeat protein
VASLPPLQVAGALLVALGLILCLKGLVAWRVKVVSDRYVTRHARATVVLGLWCAFGVCCIAAVHSEEPVSGQKPPVTGAPSAQSLLQSGNEQYAKGDFKAAVASYQQSIVLKPTAEAYLRQGLALFKTGDYEKALACFKDGRRLNPDVRSSEKVINDKAGALKRQAGLKILAKQYDEAKKLLDEALRLAPREAEICFQVGILYSKQRQYAQAAEWFERALACNSLHEKSYCMLGTTFTSLGKPREANLFLKASLLLQPDDKYEGSIRKEIEENERRIAAAR